MSLICAFISCLAVVSCIIYVLAIAGCTAGWIMLKPPVIPSGMPATRVSIVVPARNEQMNISACLKDMADQRYPKELYEIIVIDDCSADLTAEKTEEFIKNNPQVNIRLIKLTEDDGGRSHKKRAITAAVSQSSGELIVTTDADCRRGTGWLMAIGSFYETSGAVMIVAPVCMVPGRSVLQRMQALEFMGLVAASGGTIGINLPVLCNGANLAYRKSAFELVNGFQGSEHIASGDDMFLMHKMNRIFPQGIRFLKSPDAVVYTKPETTVSGFLSQRKRWVSKIKNISDAFVICLACTVFLVNVSIVLLPAAFLLSGVRDSCAAVFWGIGAGSLSMLIFSAKCLIDFLFLLLAASFFKRKGLLRLFFPAQIVNAVYVIFIGIIGITGKYRWKNRMVK